MILDNIQLDKPIAAALHFSIWAQSAKAPDEIASRCGLKQIGPAWRQVSRIDAQNILSTLLAQELAYGAPRLDQVTATRASREFVLQFSERADYYTNGSWETSDSNVQKLSSWHPLSEFTFDSGIIALDHSKSGITWLADED